jgi:hypothetical protein
VLVNRFEKKGRFRLPEIKEAVGAPVGATFANAYLVAQEALLGGRQIGGGTPLGKQLAALPERCLEIRSPWKQPKRRRFPEVFFSRSNSDRSHRFTSI